MKSEAGGKKSKRSPSTEKLIKNMQVDAKPPEGMKIVGIEYDFITIFRKDIQKKLFTKKIIKKSD